MLRFVLMIDITDWNWEDVPFKTVLLHFIFNRQQWEYLLKQYKKVRWLSCPELKKQKWKLNQRNKIKLNGNMIMALSNLQLSSNPEIFVKMVKDWSRHSKINYRNASLASLCAI